MRMDQPFLSSSLAGLFIRVPIGLYFFISGRLLLNDIDKFVEVVQSFQIVGHEVSYVYAIFLPYAQILVGGLLILGFMTTFAAFLAIFLVFTFIFAFGIYPDPHIPFNKDIVWFFALVALLGTGPGILSIDSFRNSSGGSGGH